MTQARIPMVEADEASKDVQSMYDQVEQGFGQVLNIVKVLGNSPAMLSPTLGLLGALNNTKLDSRYVELGYLKASQVNNCAY